MQIDNKNFQKEKPAILANIRKSSFIAFDFEFTGLTTDAPSCTETEFQDESEHYERVKQISANFSILQFGITCFEYKDGVYQTHCYNIYTRSNPKGKNRRNLFICDADSLEFLAGNEMDWNKVFRNGVYSRRLSERQQAIEEITERLTERRVNDFEFLSPKDEVVFREVEENLLRVFKEGKEAVVDFHSKIILAYVQKKYNFVFGDRSKKPDLKEFEFPIKAPKGNKFLIKQQDETQKTIDKARLQQLIHNEMGVSELVEEMIKYHIPLVGHWNHLDVGFLYHWYIAELPPTYEEYQHSLIKCFPYIYDTKVLSRCVQKQIKGLKVDLESLSDGCYNPMLLGGCNNVIAPKVNKYVDGKCAHEAGYDSYITGLVFAAMCNFLGAKEKVEKVQKQDVKGGEVVKGGKKKSSKQPKQQQPKLTQYDPKQPPQFPEIKYATFPHNLITYSKTSGEILMGSETKSTKFENFLVIESTFKNQDKELKQICNVLKEYGSLRVSIRDKTYIEFVEKQDLEAILKENPKLGLIGYKDRKAYKATIYL